jgi:tape measure domain-containing protein
MARYTINFSTNASSVVEEIAKINAAIAKVARTGEKVTIDLDTKPLRASFDATFRQLDRQIAQLSSKLSRLPIGSRRFQQQATAVGIAEGIRERGGMQARAIRLGAQAGAFDEGSAVRLRKELEAASIEAAQITPNTESWLNFQRQIGQIKSELQAADRLAENVQLSQSLGAFSPNSLGRLEAQLTILRNRAREIAPRTQEWRELRKEILKTEQSIEKITRRPLTRGQRLGAAGGAFLYGGGLGGGAGSALGGVAGGLVGGVPGAFTGAALGQLADNVATAMARIASQASAVQQMQRGLAMASIDAKDFAEAQATVASMSQRLLMPLEQATRLFTQLRVNTKQYNLSVKDTADIMEGTALAIMATGGSTEDLEGAMRAVVQIFSKGGVQAEELRGQLGERFPGAVVKFAQANKLSFEELQKGLEQGNIGIKEFVEFARKNYTDYAKFSEQIATAPEFAGRRLAKALEEIQLVIGQAFAPAGAMIQDFVAQGLKDIAKFVSDNKGMLMQLGQDFAVVFAGVMSVVAQAGKFIIQSLSPVLGYIANVIRQLRVMTGAADAATSRAEMSAAFALMKKYGPGRAKGYKIDTIEYNKALERYTKAETQFKAAGGSAALPSQEPTPQGFTFGGPGGGMSMERTGTEKAGRQKQAKELKEFVNNNIETLRKRLDYEKKNVDASLSLLEREKTVQKARLDLQYGQQIIDEQLVQAQRESLQYRTQDRARFLDEQKEQAKVERDTLRAEFAATVAGPLLQGNEQLAETYTELGVRMTLAREGRFELNEVDKAGIEISKAILALTPEEIAGLQEKIDERMQLAAAVDKLNAALAREVKLNEMNNRLRLAGIFDPRLELRERFRQENPLLGASDIEQMARLQEQIDQAEQFKESMTGAAQAIGDAFSTAFKGIVNGSMTAQQALASFFQSVGDYFVDMAARMIAEWLKMQAIGLVQSLLGGALGGLAGAFGAAGQGPSGAGALTPGAGAMSALPTSYGPPGAGGLGSLGSGGGFGAFSFTGFANGGIVKGPTLGLVGEGRYNEAIVPLPDGRSIPVDLGNAAGNQIVSNITVNVSNGQAQSNANGSNSSELGRKLEGAVKQVIVGELRPGGLLAGRR